MHFALKRTDGTAAAFDHRSEAMALNFDLAHFAVDADDELSLCLKVAADLGQVYDKLAAAVGAADSLTLGAPFFTGETVERGLSVLGAPLGAVELLFALGDAAAQTGLLLLQGVELLAARGDQGAGVLDLRHDVAGAGLRFGDLVLGGRRALRAGTAASA